MAFRIPWRVITAGVRHCGGLRRCTALQQSVVPVHSRLLPASSFCTSRLLHKDEAPSNQNQSEEEAAFPPFEEHMLYTLVCPVSKKPLWYDKVNSRLISEEAMLAYPVEDGIPWLIPLHAKALTEEELAEIKKELNIVDENESEAPPTPTPSPVPPSSAESKDKVH